MHPSPTSAAAIQPDTQPVLTLYPDGQANLNGDAARLLPSQAESLVLLPPGGSRRYWLLLPAVGGLVGDTLLYARKDRPGNLRLRAPTLARALFAALPESQQALRLQLVAETASTGLFRLLPLPST